MKILQKIQIRRIVVLLLLVTFLTLGVGRVTSAYALALEITPELEPVYDTEVVTLKDYVDNVLTDAQVAVFNTFLGSYVASQAGLNEYDLEYPYTDRTGVIGWLQDAGMKLYNAIITGGSFDFVTGTDLRTYIVTAASYAIGMAQKAHTYTDMDDFLDDVDTSTHYFVPIDPILQASINSYFGRDYGLWNWQFDSKPFNANFNWVHVPLGTNQYTYDAYYNELAGKKFKYNEYYSIPTQYYNTNIYYGNVFGLDNVCILLNTAQSSYAIWDMDSNTQAFFSCTKLYAYTQRSNNYVVSIRRDNLTNKTISGSLNLQNYNTILDAVNYIYSDLSITYDILNIAPRCFVGTSWNIATASEIFNISDLNFSQNESPSYNQIPNNSYIDLKGFLTDIVNNTNILNVILDNLFKPDGTLNVDPALVKVSITIPDTNPLPVNLNDISVYTMNDYLEVVKENARDYSSTVGEWFVFWHNSDPVLTYTLLGAGILLLLGAFVGKWGHS